MQTRRSCTRQALSPQADSLPSTLPPLPSLLLPTERYPHRDTHYRLTTDSNLAINLRPRGPSVNACCRDKCTCVINTGLLIVRNARFTKQLLEEMTTLPNPRCQPFFTERQWEQDCMQAMLNASAELPSLFSLKQLLSKQVPSAALSPNGHVCLLSHAAFMPPLPVPEQFMTKSRTADLIEAYSENNSNPHVLSLKNGYYSQHLSPDPQAASFFESLVERTLINFSASEGYDGSQPFAMHVMDRVCSPNPLCSKTLLARQLTWLRAQQRTSRPGRQPAIHTMPKESGTTPVALGSGISRHIDISSDISVFICARARPRDSVDGASMLVRALASIRSVRHLRLSPTYVSVDGLRSRHGALLFAPEIADGLSGKMAHFKHEVRVREAASDS